MIESSWITPDWPTPDRVRAFSTTRLGGVSRPPYDALNLAKHVADADQSVMQNRDFLRRQLALPHEPKWLDQVHGVRVVDAAAAKIEESADGAYASQPGQVCVVMTADCLPVLLCRADGSAVAAVHAGWRGLASGILQAGIEQLPGQGEVLAWLGPAIGPSAFEVGAEVRDQFVAQQPHYAQAFQPVDAQHYLADLYALARMVLVRRGVQRIYGGQWCTVNQPDLFFSYRRDGATGRMASLIWLESDG